MLNPATLFQHSDELQRVRCGQNVFSEGQMGRIMFVIVEGHVDIFVRGRLVETAGPGQILGEMALIDDRPRSATAVAKTDCKLAPINEKRFTTLIQETPRFALMVMRSIADRLRRSNARM